MNVQRYNLMKNDKLQYKSFYEEVHRLIGVNSIDEYRKSLPIMAKNTWLGSTESLYGIWTKWFWIWDW